MALARSVVAGDDLAAGRLLRLFPEIGFESELAYHVVYRPECADQARRLAFRDGLFDEVHDAASGRSGAPERSA